MVSERAKINVLFPVETINRELDGRLLLGCLYVSKSNRVFIGQHDVIQSLVGRLRGGMYLGKNMFTRVFPHDDLARYHALKEHGFVVVHLDEEGAVFSGDDTAAKGFLSVRLDPRCLASDDFICTWGEFQREFYASLGPRCAANIRTTGHPRFDLYRPAYRSYFEEEARAIQARYGDFVLVNTNMSYANNGVGLYDTFSATNGYDATDPRARVDYVNMWAHDAHILTNVVKLVTRLSVEFPALNFVIRPHPAEDWSYYETIFRGVGNVCVIHDGPVGPWLFACRVLIHDGCTTGVEAYMAGTPIINYKSLIDSRYDLFLPNVFGARCVTEEEVIDQIATICAAPFRTPAVARFTDLVHRLMDNFQHESARKVMEVLTEAEAGIPHASACSDLTIRARETVRSARAVAKGVVRPIFRVRQQQHLFFRRSHFYGFTQRFIETRIRRIEAIIQKRVRWKLFGDSLLTIESAE